jgi:hypothetical protein
MRLTPSGVAHPVKTTTVRKRPKTARLTGHPINLAASIGFSHPNQAGIEIRNSNIENRNKSDQKDYCFNLVS